MLRWMVVPLLLFGLAFPAAAEKNLSIDQMEQLLVTLHGRSDGKSASELGEVQVTERVSPLRLAHWQAKFPGPKTREMLMQIADMSAFLDPPVSDVVPNPRPNIEAQKQMLRLTVQYVESTMSRLPAFYATRETTHFEDTLSQHAASSVQGGPTGSAPIGLSGGTGGPSGMNEHEDLAAISLGQPGVATSVVFKALHSTGTFDRTVTYRDGREVSEPVDGKQAKEPPLGLTSEGEFGSILAKVLVDALQNRIGFMRWEQSASGAIAVFHYSVPAEKSRFEVAITSGTQVQGIHPAYHGEIAIDPRTGEILRLTEVAEMTPPYQAMRAAIEVKYGPVTIGGRSFICPVNAVAFSKTPVPTQGVTDQSAWPVQTELNDVAFTHYHEFRSETRIVTNLGEGSGGNPADIKGSTLPESSTAVAALGSSIVPASAPASSAPAAETASASPLTSPSTSAPAASAPAPPGPASSPEDRAAPATAAAATPPQPANASFNAPAAGAVFHAQSKLVLVDVAVTEHDRPVKSLDRGRFHVFEDGRELPIASFEENQPPANVEIAEPPALPPDTYSNQPVYPETNSVNVLLLDALNTPASDQEQLRRQMIHFLGAMKPGTPMAVFTLSSQLRMAAGFTTDVAQVLKALESPKTKTQTASSNLSGDLQSTASGMANNSDPGTIWLVNTIQQFATDTETYENDQRVMMTLDGLDQLARYLAAVPGRKNVIWFSGSFPIGLAPDALGQAAIKNVRDYSSAVRETSELISAARVSVYPVDARGPMTAPSSSATYVPSAVGGRQSTMAPAIDNTNFSRQTSLEKDSMNTIATETGGHVYSTGNDLKAAIEKITANDAYYYALSYVPQADKKDGQFHKIEIKIDSGGKYQLAYRRGYYSGAGNNPASRTGPAAAAAEAGAPPSTQILFRARVLPQDAPELNGAALDDKAAGEKTANFRGGAHRYVVDLSLKPQDIPLAQDADGRRSTQLECDLVAYDSKGQMVNSLGRALRFSLTPQQYEQLTAAGGAIPVRLAIDLPTGEIALRIVLYDAASARTGSLEIPVEAAGKQAGSQANAAPQ